MSKTPNYLGDAKAMVVQACKETLNSSAAVEAQLAIALVLIALVERMDTLVSVENFYRELVVETQDNP